jgi:branched-chain amino acid transport system substrate-binding protein
MNRFATIAVCLGSALLALSAGRAAAQDQTPIRIGLSQIASGPYADYWNRQVNKPALLAIDDANAKGGVRGRKVVGILEDNKGDATTGAAVAHKLIEIDKVEMIFVAPTPPALATLPIAEAAHVPVVSTSTSPKIGQSPWGAVAQPPADRSGVAYAKFAIAHQVKRVASIAEDNDSVAISVAAFRAGLVKGGIEMVDAETYKAGSQDYSAQLTKIRAADPDLMLMQSASAASYGYILKQMAELGFRPHYVLTYYQITDPQVRKVAGDLVNGVYFIQIPVDTDWNARVFKPRMGYDADGNGALAYDAIAIYLDGYAQAANDDPQTVRQAMLDYKGYKGAVGAWGYNGQPVTQLEFEPAIVLPDGSFKLLPY